MSVSTVQLTGGGFQDSEGNVLNNGTIKLILSEDCVTSDGRHNIAGALEVVLLLDANGNFLGTQIGDLVQRIWSNDVLLPAGSYYTAVAFTSVGQLAWKTPQTWTIANDGTITVGGTSGGGGGGGGGTVLPAGLYVITYFAGDSGVPPTGSQVLLRHSISGVVASVTFPVALLLSTVGALHSPAADFIITIKQNGVSVGTMTIPAGQVTGTFSFVNQIISLPSDTWDFIAPAVADTTINGIYFTISATRL